MFELANEPINILGPDGTYGAGSQGHFDKLKEYFQSVVDAMRAQGPPLQLEHLNEWGHGSPFLVSNLGGLVLALALQHQPNSLWCSDLWGLLHLMHLAPWIQHKKVEWSYF